MLEYKVGPVAITRIEEVLERGFEPAQALPGFDPALFERVPQLAGPDYYDAASGKLMSSIQSWLIRLDGRTILVDTASGNGKARALPLFGRFHMLDGPWLDNLTRAGVRPEDVDTVVCTHLHVDHVGWNTRRDGDRWVPTFPNARYLFGRLEHEHWAEGGAGRRLFPPNIDVILDSVDPVVDAGLVDLIEDGDEIAPGFVAELAPGHTAAQLILKYRSGDACFVCSADVMNQPIQIYAPHLNSWFCEDSEAARATRQRLLAWCAETGALLLPSHFGWPHAGYVRRSGDGYAFEPATPLSRS